MRSLRLDPLRHIAVPAALLAVVAFNILAVTLPLGGRATEEISAMFENMFTPAGWAFSIWSVIYAGLAAFTLYQFLPSQADSPVARQTALLFTFSCLFNIAWLLSWHFLAIPLSFGFMLALLATLILIYLRVTRRRPNHTVAYGLMVALPFRLYLGWIIVATSANLMALLTARDWDFAPFGETGFVLLLAGVTVMAGLLALFTRKELFVNLVLIWGLVAVAFGPASTSQIMVGSLAGAAILLAAVVWTVVRGRQKAVPDLAAQTPLNSRRQ